MGQDVGFWDWAAVLYGKHLIISWAVLVTPNILLQARSISYHGIKTINDASATQESNNLPRPDFVLR